jgi:nucleoside-diphosphate-sugar epimerase
MKGSGGTENRNKGNLAYGGMNLNLQDNRTVLVTGGAGFIGSHICEALLRRGYNCISVDSFSQYYPSEYKRENIE